ERPGASPAAAPAAAPPPVSASGQLKQLGPDAEVLAGWSRFLLAEPERLQLPAVLELGAVELAQGFTLLTAGAELAGAYGAYVKSRYAGSVLPVGYSNGLLGYICTRDQLSEGGYEAADFIYYFGLPAPLASETEETVCAAIDDVLHEQFGAK
ncbi:hypothetical protein, partial [Paenibacillus thalictri]|uniref:hypothetical protein n=1 Tax=Paenibacillus thalictri TaxID=2527873 RepID=UPI00197E2D83